MIDALPLHAAGARPVKGLGSAAPCPLPARWVAGQGARDLSPIWCLLLDRGARERAAPGQSALDHALACANLALEAGADADLVTAGLLHDVGHLLREDLPGPQGFAGRERHAMVGAAFLSLWFGPGVTEPVRLHAEAKRYLCGVEPGYAERLHPGARSSLERNGGSMSAAEASAFLGGAHARAAILLRRWDDRAIAAPSRPGDLPRFQKLAKRCLV